MAQSPFDHDLERRVRALELASSSRPWTPSRARPGTRRLIVIVGLIIGVAVMPMVTAASDFFVDVADSHKFHDEISELRAAGITRGCDTAPPRFCPDDAVSRGQMAALLTRGLGRVWESNVPIVELAESGQLDTLTVTPPIRGYLLVTASIAAFAPSEDGPCPCTIMFPLVYEGDRSHPRPTLVLSGSGANGRLSASASHTELIPVPAGHSTIRLHGFMENRDAGTVAFGVRMTALFVPFGTDE